MNNPIFKDRKEVIDIKSMDYSDLYLLKQKNDRMWRRMMHYENEREEFNERICSVITGAAILSIISTVLTSVPFSDKMSIIAITVGAAGTLVGFNTAVTKVINLLAEKYAKTKSKEMGMDGLEEEMKIKEFERESNRDAEFYLGRLYEDIEWNNQKNIEFLERSNKWREDKINKDPSASEYIRPSDSEITKFKEELIEKGANPEILEMPYIKKLFNGIYSRSRFSGDVNPDGTFNMVIHRYHKAQLSFDAEYNMRLDENQNVVVSTSGIKNGKIEMYLDKDGNLNKMARITHDRGKDFVAYLDRNGVFHEGQYVIPKQENVKTM